MKTNFTLLFLGIIASFSLNAQNLIKGGGMEEADESAWSVSTLETDEANSSSYEFNYTDDSPSGGEGGALHYTINNTGANGAHLMFYQAIEIELGTEYIFDLSAKAIQEMNNSWLEVYIGETEPADGADYGEGSTALGGFKWSGWEDACAGLDLFDGTLQNDGCLAGSQGSFTIEGTGTQTMYVGFKAGIWATETTIEFVVDNVSLTKVGSVGTNDVEATNVTLYPNPAAQVLNIASDMDFTTARILNIAGQEVRSFSNFGSSLNVSDLNSGIYFIELTSVNSQKQVLKFQKN